MPRRPRSSSGAVARTKKEAAIQLVRLEFDMSRLQMGIEQTDQRRSVYSAELDEKKRQRGALLALLND